MVGEMAYGDPRMLEEMEGEDARRVTLAALVRSAKDTFFYEEDFGDSWEHELRMAKMLSWEVRKHYPIRLTGTRACPPEDCGGIWEYADFLDALHDPQHPAHEAMVAWIGGACDPEAFDLDAVHRALHKFASPAGGRRPRSCGRRQKKPYWERSYVYRHSG